MILTCDGVTSRIRWWNDGDSDSSRPRMSLALICFEKMKE